MPKVILVNSDDDSGFITIEVIPMPHESIANQDELNAIMEAGAELSIDDPSMADAINTSVESGFRVKVVLSTNAPLPTDSAGSLSDFDRKYFESYGTLGVQELMLKDAPRTLAYKEAILRNRGSIAGKVVMDVGAGTGILSILAAKCGAKKVIAIEAGGMAQVIRHLAQANGVGHIVTVVNARVEDILSLPDGVETVDVVISEWMGFYCFHESMLNSVLVARDRWMSRSGMMMPGEATLFVSPCSLTKLKTDKIDYFDNVYGLDFSLLKQIAIQDLLLTPYVECINKEELLCEGKVLASFDLNTCTAEQLRKIQNTVSFTAARDGELAGFTIWFDVVFSGRGGGGSGSGSPKVVTLSTAPHAPDTHWKQSSVLLGGWFPVSAGEEIAVQVLLEQDPSNMRCYKLSVST